MSNRATFGEGLPRFRLRRTPLGALVGAVARVPVSIHAKLLSVFLLVALLVLAVGVTGLETLSSTSSRVHLLDGAHTRVDAARQIEHALAMQMNFTAMALVLGGEATIAEILRERA